MSAGIKFDDIKKRAVFLLFALIIFRIGAHIPIPGINIDVLNRLFQNNKTGLMDMVNLFSGGSLSRFTVFALGIMPYISASIFLQLATEASSYLKQLKKDGESGRRKISQYTRYTTVFLALVQSIGVSLMMYRQPNLVSLNLWNFLFTAVLCLVTGTMFLMWVGEQITERGIGNGASVIITSGIISGIPSAAAKTFALSSQGSMSIFSVLIVFFAILFVTYIVVFVERAQRKIPVNYVKRQVGNKITQAQSSHLPLKINMSGVIPPIFASSALLFLSSAISWISRRSYGLQPGELIYTILYLMVIIFFCFFYTALVFNPKETADNLKKSSAIIPGIRPGECTSKYIEKILLRLTLSGAIYIALVCLLPEIMILKWNVPFYFGGTSLLIVVVVIMDIITQIQSLTVSTQYNALLRKTSLQKT